MNLTVHLAADPRQVLLFLSLSLFDKITTAVTQESPPEIDRPISKVLCSPTNPGYISQCSLCRLISNNHFGTVDASGRPVNELSCYLVPMDRIQKEKHQLTLCFRYLCRLLFLVGRLNGDVKAVPGHFIHRNSKSG